MSEDVDVPKAWRQLVPGHRYRVEFDDCCVQGWFVATFERLDIVPDVDGTPFLDGLVFDIAHIRPDWGPIRIEEQDERTRT